MFYLSLFIAGGLGVLCRFMTVKAAQHFFPAILFPIGTLTVNILGSCLFGFLSWYLVERYSSVAQFEVLKVAVLTGFLGGYTTFSAFSMEMLHLIQTGYVFKAFSYAFVSVTVCVLACFLGLLLAKQLV